MTDGTSQDYNTVTLQAGDVLFNEGEAGDCAYYIQSGMIEISRQMGSAEVVIATEEEGGIVGEMALIDNKPRSATARAVEDTTLLRVPAEQFDQYLENTDPVIRQLLKRFVDIIRNVTTENVRLILGIR
ncbi:MAG: cyclic nucleotide-binding domain-containing protein [Rhodospirillaceae bacterium]